MSSLNLMLERWLPTKLNSLPRLADGTYTSAIVANDFSSLDGLGEIMLLQDNSQVCTEQWPNFQPRYGQFGLGTHRMCFVCSCDSLEGECREHGNGRVVDWRSVIVRLGSPVCASLSLEGLAVEYDWNRYDLNAVLRARLD